MTFWQLATDPPRSLTVRWQRAHCGAVFIEACGVRCYLAELLAAEHSALWDYVAEVAR